LAAAAAVNSKLIYHLALDASCGHDAKAIADVENVSSWKINITGHAVT
jgi:hypothetical protein